MALQRHSKNNLHRSIIIYKNKRFAIKSIILSSHHPGNRPVQAICLTRFPDNFGKTAVLPKFVGQKHGETPTGIDCAVRCILSYAPRGRDHWRCLCGGSLPWVGLAALQSALLLCARRWAISNLHVRELRRLTAPENLMPSVPPCVLRWAMTIPSGDP